jgi:hypothetical protein
VFCHVDESAVSFTNVFAHCCIAPFAHGGLLFGVVFSFPVSFSEVVMKLSGLWFAMAGQEHHGLVQVEGLGFFKEHGHLSLQFGEQSAVPGCGSLQVGWLFQQWWW